MTATAWPPRQYEDELPRPEDWTELALCQQTDPEAFFPEKGASTREAKKVCGACVVREECLEYALRTGERFGVWGGLSERERRDLQPRERVTVPPGHKQCTKCRDVRPLGAFHRNRTDPSGFASRCRDCRNTARRAQRKAAA